MSELKKSEIGMKLFLSKLPSNIKDPEMSQHFEDDETYLEWNDGDFSAFLLFEDDDGYGYGLKEDNLNSYRAGETEVNSCEEIPSDLIAFLETNFNEGGIKGRQYDVEWKLGERVRKGHLIVSPNEISHGKYENDGWKWFFGNSNEDTSEFESFTADNYNLDNGGFPSAYEAIVDAMEHGIKIIKRNI